MTRLKLIGYLILTARNLCPYLTAPHYHIIRSIISSVIGVVVGQLGSRFLSLLLRYRKYHQLVARGRCLIRNEYSR